jgi:hypothetical protein
MRLEFSAMYRDEVPEAYVKRIDAPEDLSLNVWRRKSLTDIMVRVRCNEPQFTYLMPVPRDRRRVLSWFFNSVAIPACERYGEIFTSTTIDAAVLWIRPGRPVTFRRMVLSGLRAFPITLGLTTANRCLDVGIEMEKIRYQLTGGPHWYLLSLAAEDSQGRGSIAGGLLEPVLGRADLDRCSCYIETFLERDLPFYKTLGFRIEGSGALSRYGPSFWAMVRPPQGRA